MFCRLVFWQLVAQYCIVVPMCIRQSYKRELTHHCNKQCLPRWYFCLEIIATHTESLTIYLHMEYLLSPQYRYWDNCHKKTAIKPISFILFYTLRNNCKLQARVLMHQQTLLLLNFVNNVGKINKNTTLPLSTMLGCSPLPCLMVIMGSV